MSRRQTEGPKTVDDVAVPPPGWSPAAWAAYLRRRADGCREIRPDLAELYRSAAVKIHERIAIEKAANDPTSST